MKNVTGIAVASTPSASTACQCGNRADSAPQPEKTSVSSSAPEPETICWPSASRIGSPDCGGTART